MSLLHVALADYLSVRRAMGYKLERAPGCHCCRPTDPILDLMTHPITRGSVGGQQKYEPGGPVEGVGDRRPEMRVCAQRRLVSEIQSARLFHQGLANRCRAACKRGASNPSAACEYEMNPSRDCVDRSRDPFLCSINPVASGWLDPPIYFIWREQACRTALAARLQPSHAACRHRRRYRGHCDLAVARFLLLAPGRSATR